MSNHGTASKAVQGWFVEFQMAVLRALPRDIKQEIADEWRKDGKVLSEILRRVLVGETANENGVNLKLISSGKTLVLDAVDGTETLFYASDVFVGRDPNFEEYGANEKGPATEETLVEVYNMEENATFSKMFGSLSVDVKKLCLTQAQIKNFCKKYRQWLMTDGDPTFFLFKSKGLLFVAFVYFRFNGELGVSVNIFEDSYTWAELRCRVVVPKLAA